MRLPPPQAQQFCFAEPLSWPQLACHPEPTLPCAVHQWRCAYTAQVPHASLNARPFLFLSTQRRVVGSTVLPPPAPPVLSVGVHVPPWWQGALAQTSTVAAGNPNPRA